MDRQARRTSPRGLTASAVVAVLVVLAVTGLVRSAGVGGPATDSQRAEEIAAGLRCPTCQGLSVADSNSPLAQSMRDIIDEQVAAGQGDDEVRQYFVSRYGDWVLLSPRADGSGWIVWVLPVAAVVVGLLVVAQLFRRRRDHADAPEPQQARGSQALRYVAVGGVLAAALGVLMAVNLGDRGEGELATGNVTPLGADTAPEPAPQTGAGGDATENDLAGLEAAVEASPDDVGLRLALASTAFEAGRADLVRAQADAVLGRDPDNVDALMLRGLSARSDQDRRATASLRRFLDLAPGDHPAVPLVRGLLGEEVR